MAGVYRRKPFRRRRFARWVPSYHLDATLLAPALTAVARVDAPTLSAGSVVVAPQITATSRIDPADVVIDEAVPPAPASGFRPVNQLPLETIDVLVRARPCRAYAFIPTPVIVAFDMDMELLLALV